MGTVDFDVFDADNHYYEAHRRLHPAPRPADGEADHAVGRGRRSQRLLVGGKVNRFIPNPSSTPWPGPAASTTTSAARSPANDIRGAFGELEPISPAYRDRDARSR
jgi:hypothetical protein